MHADFEPLVGMIRVYDDEMAFPDSYRWTVTCRFVDAETVEVLGVVKPPTKDEWRALLKTLGNMGVAEVFYRQYKHGELRVRRHRIPDNANHS